MSTYNLVLISWERYHCACHPFRHAEITAVSRRKLAIYTLLLYLLVIIITHGTYIQVSSLKSVQMFPVASPTNGFAHSGKKILDDIAIS